MQKLIVYFPNSPEHHRHAGGYPKTKHNNRMDNIEERLGNLETFISYEVEKTHAIKSDTIENLKDDIN